MIHYRAALDSLTVTGGNGTVRALDDFTGTGNRYEFRPDGYAQRGCLRYIVPAYAGVDGEAIKGFALSSRRFRPVAGWPLPGPFFGRLRMRIAPGQTLIPAAGAPADGEFKFFIRAAGAYDGDQRHMLMLFSGSAYGSGRRDEDGIQVSCQRNISHQTEAARGFVPADGQWHHVQWAWRHGPQGQSFLKLWIDTNAVSRPTAQDLVLDQVPSVPGGTSEWFATSAAYDDQTSFGFCATTGTRLARDFAIDLQDLEEGDAFDPAWAPLPWENRLPDTYREGVTEVEALQVLPNNDPLVQAFCPAAVDTEEEDPAFLVGGVRAGRFDWIVRDGDGSFRVVRRADFDATFTTAAARTG
jgi:hypothetical protein